MEFLVAAYTAVWILVFGYVFYLVRRQRELQQQIDMLNEVIEEQQSRPEDS